MAARQELGLALLRKYRATALPPDFEATLNDLRERVRNIAATCINRPQLEFFGSYSSGFCKRDADADLSLTWSAFNPLLGGMDTTNDATDKKMHRLGRAAADSGMLAVRYVASRIPVVQFEDHATQIVCDISVGNVGGVENSRILRQIHDVHDVVGLYVFAVKEWAKAKEVISPEKGTFNSFTVTTMSIMVLQELGLLPAFAAPTGMFGELTLQDVQAALSRAPKHAAFAGLNPSDDVAMAEALVFLLGKFAEYYSAFDFEKGTVSIIHPRRLRPLYHDVAQVYLAQLKEAKKFAWENWSAQNKVGAIDMNELSNAIHHEAVQRPSDSCFVVEDFVNYVNCGRRVHLPRKKYVLDQFVQLKTMMLNPALTCEKLLQPTADLKQVVTDFTQSGERRVTRFN